ncbi:hypothetical protein EWM64_g9681 [Hericium alpestre]|uniref:GRF-type domain-containing protein n=1 Tax=Hericium alpestre TaxID=135208 RepID=A0A4Y9ZKF0_9AGAM|nr:hypothetical protein EWM64_g9681 [Hericium alpestre]
MVASPAKSIPINTKIALVDDNGDVLCWHGIPAVKRTSKTASHPDRVFWACSIYRGEEGHCKFFKWDDELPPHNNPADPSRQWHPPAQSSQSTQSSQGVAATPFSGPSSQPAPVSTSTTQSQPSSQTQPSSQPPPGQSQGMGGREQRGGQGQQQQQQRPRSGEVNEYDAIPGVRSQVQ